MKIGDMVKVKWLIDQVYTGILVDIEKKRELFSDKFSVVHSATYLHILCNGKIEILDADDCVVVILNESR